MSTETNVALESLARVITGDADPAGRLPVDIPANDDPGSTLYPFGAGLSW
jgi:beta-N-acetylhexosaminidase